MMSSKFLKRFLLPVATCLLFIWPVITLAQDIDDTKGFQGGIKFIEGELEGKDRSGISNFGGDFGQLIIAALKILLGLVGIIAVAVLIWGGIKYIISLGDEDAAKEAKRLILYAIIGLLIIGAAALLVNLIIGIFGAGNR